VLVLRRNLIFFQTGTDGPSLFGRVRVDRLEAGLEPSDMGERRPDDEHRLARVDVLSRARDDLPDGKAYGDRDPDLGRLVPAPAATRRTGHGAMKPAFQHMQQPLHPDPVDLSQSGRSTINYLARPHRVDAHPHEEYEEADGDFGCILVDSSGASKTPVVAGAYLSRERDWTLSPHQRKTPANRGLSAAIGAEKGI
jgi:hypothetical protein